MGDATSFQPSRRRFVISAALLIGAVTHAAVWAAVLASVLAWYLALPAWIIIQSAIAVIYVRVVRALWRA